MIKVKQQYDDLKLKLIEMQNMNNSLVEAKKVSDDKNSMFKFQINSMKSQIRERDNEIGKLKNELEELECYKYDKEKYQKTLNQTIKNSQGMKEEIERKSRHIKELEKVLSEMNYKMESAESNQKDKSSKEVNLVNMKEKDKRIKYLETENNKLRADLDSERMRISELEYEISTLKEGKGDAQEIENLKKQIDTLRSNNSEWQGLIC